LAELASLGRCSLVLLSCFLALSSLTGEAGALQDPIQLGDDPSGDADPGSMDILIVQMVNNGTHLTFILECRTVPAPSSVRTYGIWLDTEENSGATAGPYIGADWYVQGGGVPGLYEVGGDESTTLVYRAPIEVEVRAKSIRLSVSLSDIGYPQDVKGTVGVVATTHQPVARLRDRSPDLEHYSVAHEVIPELPWPTPLFFIPAIGATILTVYRWKFKQARCG